MQKVDILETFSEITELWQPTLVAELNGQCVKVAKVQGRFVWHAHAEHDEMCLVVEGRLRMQFRDGEVALDPGEMIVTPAGVEHRPVAEAECWVMQIDPQPSARTYQPEAEPTTEVPGPHSPV
jgi:mannose-6-phosphate isomerase-like protein (cupin superfamily)